MVSKVEKEQQKLQKMQKNESHQQAMNLAASWYIAMGSKELKKKPKAIELFSQPLVAWRNQQGHPVIMERFCAHMGASLAIGKLKDGCLQCPFHHWQFDSTGECVSIPEIDKIPATARQKTYVTTERYGYIWVWYGTETPLFPLPEFPPAESEQKNYMSVRDALNINTTVCRVLENSYDVAHLFTVHGLKTTGTIEITSLNDPNPKEQVELTIEKEYLFGVEIKIKIGDVGAVRWFVKDLKPNAKNQLLYKSKQESWPSGSQLKIYLNNQEKFQMLAGLTPIAENKVTLHMIVGVKRTGNFIRDLANYLTFGLWNMIKAKQEDVPIWNKMKSDHGGAYVKSDYEVLKFREFYQSWVDRVE